MDERPPPDPTKLLVAWMEWERGDTPPGRVLSTLKIAGMREFLEAWLGTLPVSLPPYHRRGEGIRRQP